MVKERGRRKVRLGTILSDRMDKTRVVGVEWSLPHPLYRRRVRRVTRFKAHDEQNATRQGDVVRIMETRALSRHKRWRIIEVVEKAEIVELRPEEVDTTLLEELSGQPEAVAEVEVEAPPAEEKPKPRRRTRAAKAEAEAPAAEAAVAEETPKPKRRTRAAKAEAAVAEETPKPKRRTRAAKAEAEAPAAEEAPKPRRRTRAAKAETPAPEEAEEQQK